MVEKITGSPQNLTLVVVLTQTPVLSQDSMSKINNTVLVALDRCVSDIDVSTATRSILYTNLRSNTVNGVSNVCVSILAITHEQPQAGKRLYVVMDDAPELADVDKVGFGAGLKTLVNQLSPKSLAAVVETSNLTGFLCKSQRPATWYKAGGIRIYQFNTVDKPKLVSLFNQLIEKNETPTQQSAQGDM